jgi:hypothetical protein
MWLTHLALPTAQRPVTGRGARYQKTAAAFSGRAQGILRRVADLRHAGGVTNGAMFVKSGMPKRRFPLA